MTIWDYLWASCLLRNTLLMILLLLAQLTPALAKDKETLSMASDVWCPYVCDDKNKPGYLFEVAEKVYQDAGYKTEFFITPFERALIGVQQGNFDLALPVSAKDISSFHLVSSRIAVGFGETLFYATKDRRWTYEGPDSLKKVKLGVIKGYEYGPIIDQHIAFYKQHEWVVITHGDQPLAHNIKMLVNGRIDVMLENKAVVDYTAKELGYAKDIKVVGSATIDEILLAGFSPKHPNVKQLVALLKQGITQLRSSGELQKILNRYGLSDWQEKVRSLD